MFGMSIGDFDDEDTDDTETDTGDESEDATVV